MVRYSVRDLSSYGFCGLRVILDGDMSKQEDIREGIKGLTFFVEDTEYWEIGNLFVLREKAITKLLNYLHSQGVVLKVDRELPMYVVHPLATAQSEAAFLEGREQLIEAGYVATVPLIDIGKIPGTEPTFKE